MKQTAKKRIIVWSIISVLLCAGLVTGIMFSKSGTWADAFRSGYTLVNFGDSSDTSGYTDGDSEFSAEEVRSVDISWYAGSVEFKPYSGDKLKISEKRESGEAFCWKLGGSTLSVRAGRATAGFLRFNLNAPEKKTLTVEYPEGKRFDNIYIGSASADVLIDSLTAADMKIDTASGSVNIKASKTSKLTLNAASGSLTAADFTCETLEADMISGKCSLGGDIKNIEVDAMSSDVELNVSSRLAKCEIDSVSGNIKLLVGKDSAGFNLESDSVSGRINVKDVEGSTTLDGFVYKDGAAEINVDAVSGGITVLKAE